MTNWNEAATRYRQNSLETQREKEEQELVEAVKALEAFLDSGEGITAKELLAASKQTIIVATEEHSGTGCMYILDKQGLQFSSAPAGLGAAYIQQPIQPIVKPMITIQFVKSVSRCGKKPSEILLYIRSELDKIAAAAP